MEVLAQLARRVNAVVLLKHFDCEHPLGQSRFVPRKIRLAKRTGDKRGVNRCSYYVCLREG